MLPHVDAEDRLGAVDQRVLAVGGLQDRELAVLDREPGPARAELADTRLDEVRLELVEAAEILVDLRGQGRRGRAAALGFIQFQKWRWLKCWPALLNSGWLVP